MKKRNITASGACTLIDIISRSKSMKLLDIEKINNNFFYLIGSSNIPEDVELAKKALIEMPEYVAKMLGKDGIEALVKMLANSNSSKQTIKATYINTNSNSINKTDAKNLDKSSSSGKQTANTVLNKIKKVAYKAPRYFVGNCYSAQASYFKGNKNPSVDDVRSKQEYYTEDIYLSLVELLRQISDVNDLFARLCNEKYDQIITECSKIKKGEFKTYTIEYDDMITILEIQGRWDNLMEPNVRRGKEKYNPDIDID